MFRIGRLQAIYHDYPRQFWLLAGASFIDMVGNALIFPFFALFITDRFDVGMTEVGMVFATFSMSGVLGSSIGGALADKVGRKPVFMFGLISSGLGNVTLALVHEYALLFPIATVLGLCGSVGGPAAQAMMADLLPEDRRAEGYGILRMEFNLAVTIGPMIGGLLAGVSYLLLFSVDAATSLITAGILIVWLRETKPEAAADAPSETFVQSFAGYGRVLGDHAYVFFVLITMAVSVVYFQINTTLSVFLRDVHGVAPQGFGMIISMNALMVVLMQIGITRYVRQRGYAPLLVLAAGTVLYAVGFGMYGFVAGYALFLVAMAIITIGEMLVVPVGQALAAKFAREDMRGRYMAVFGFGWSLASGFGTWLAGLVIESLGHEWVWYLGGILAAVSALGFVALHRYIQAGDRAEISLPDLPRPAVEIPSDVVADVAA